MVIDEPRARFCDVDGVWLGSSFFAEVGRGTLSATAACAMDGREALGLSDFSVFSRCGPPDAEGLKGVGIGDVDTGEEGSIVRVFRSGMGFGAMMGAGVLPLTCHLSRTDALRGGSLGFSAVVVLEGEGLLFEDPSSWLVALTMLATKPRPCSRLILGVGSLGGGGFRKVVEALCPNGTCGPCEDFLGVG